ncbi:MAG: glycine cleavage system aminomethyltransferase GcvT [Parvularculaceae bacterium]|nr:glycine cleavage system aminomethyltransferase GcvT [Parvularculaceae bacterium]
MNDPLKTTPLTALHKELGAKMVEFAGYEMPVQYPLGVLKEHLHTREKAGLFDVSHMGQAWLVAEDVEIGSATAHDAISAVIELIVPGEIRKLKPGGLRYSVLLNDDGGILDDLMITRPASASDAGRLFLVVNAACKEDDFRYISERLKGLARLERADGRALIALQGPKAAGVIDSLMPGAAAQGFMTMKSMMWGDTSVLVSRCGYTGEDGYEISISNYEAEALARTLLAHDDVEPIGLGARDSLRLEAGLCLYSHDIDTTTSPVEGNISFVIGKRRKDEANFPGAERIMKELSGGLTRLRVGLKPAGKAPAREGVEIVDLQGNKIGVITSGGFGPSVNGPVAMGYVDVQHSASGVKVQLMVRGKPVDATVVDMPVIPHNYYRG